VVVLLKMGYKLTVDLNKRPKMWGIPQKLAFNKN
jgi:hypothetical protein